jgi:hypothetical protein
MLLLTLTFYNNCQLWSEKEQFRVTFNVKNCSFSNNCQLWSEKEAFNFTFNIKNCYITIIDSYERQNLMLLLM